MQKLNKNDFQKALYERSFLDFCRYLFREITGRSFLISGHIKKIVEVLEAVERGEITRLIINMPPRYCKTELSVKMFIAWTLAKHPQSKFIHLSYSDDLALDNSSKTKEYIESDAFQRLWPMTLKSDAQGKKKWFNTLDGGVYATASGGAITGFGAGIKDSENFSGAIIIDDPLKPDDAFSDVKRKSVNERFNNTIASRCNDRSTSIIVVMQRLHEDDFSGYLLNGGSGEKWHHLCLPALDENNEPLWKEKQSFEELERIRQADRYTFAGQYLQQPAPPEGGEWKKDWFKIIKKQEIPAGIKWELFIDGAYTKETKNDPTGLQISGRKDNDLYILSSVDKYLEMPELLVFVKSFILASGVDVTQILVEPKASGKSLIQLIQRNTSLNITEIKGEFIKVSKIERARSSSPYIESGRVHLVEGGWNEAYIHQVSTFPNAKHDEHIDLTSYAIERNLMRPTGEYYY